MSLNNHETNEIRGAILITLIISYPNEASYDLIDITLTNLQMCTNPAILKDHIDYLMDNDYIECRKSKFGPKFRPKKRFFKLTTKGKEFVEANYPQT